MRTMSSLLQLLDSDCCLHPAFNTAYIMLVREYMLNQFSKLYRNPILIQNWGFGFKTVIYGSEFELS